MRNWPLTVIAVIAVILLLNYGAPFFIPLFVALLISYALSPLVDQLTRLVRAALARRGRGRRGHGGAARRGRVELGRRRAGDLGEGARCGEEHLANHAAHRAQARGPDSPR